MFDVICVGTSTVDVFANTDYSELIKIMDKRGEQDLLAYPIGSKILIRELNFTTGGGGTNVAASLARLGHRVAYLGCMGKDANADIVLNDLKKLKVDSSLVVRKEGKTGYSIVLDSIEHDRTILTYRGENNELDFKDINKNKLKAKWLYFSAMLDKSFKAQEQIAKFAEKNGIKVAFNASQYLAEKGARFLKEILSRVEILVLNKEEAELILRESGRSTIAKLSVGLSKLGPKYVVITDGEHGSYCYHDGCLYSAKAHHIKVVETTGAGDAYASTFLSGIIRKNDIVYAMQIATTNAESVISHHGAKTGLLTLSQIHKRLGEMPVEVKKSKAV
jgi:ribokinase